MMFLLLLGLADTSPRHSADWYPCRVGTKWEYTYAGTAMELSVTGKRRIGSVDCAVFEYRYGGQVSYSQVMGRDAEGIRIFVMEQNGVQHVNDSPMTVLRLPLRKGRKWEWKGTWYGTGMSAEYEDAGEEALDVLGKRTVCRKVTGTWLMGGMNIGVTTWYARGIGMVKTLYSYQGGASHEMVLKSFKAAAR